MEKPNVDDIFDDFEYKVEGKKEKHHQKEEESEEGHMKEKFQKELDKQNKERHEALKERNKEIWKEKKPGKFDGLEKGAYILIIIVLAAYIAIDFTFYHKSSDDLDEPTVPVNVVDEEDKVEEENIEAVENKTEVEEEIKLSGKILLGIEKVYSEVVDDDLGYITKINFLIENGKEEPLTPLVNVFIYDSELHESWEQRSRGEYKGTVIKSGETKTLTITVSPKTFRNLDIEKNIRLTLNDTEIGFVATVNKKILIS